MKTVVMAVSVGLVVMKAAAAAEDGAAAKLKRRWQGSGCGVFRKSLCSRGQAAGARGKAGHCILVWRFRAGSAVSPLVVKLRSFLHDDDGNIFVVTSLLHLPTD